MRLIAFALFMGLTSSVGAQEVVQPTVQGKPEPAGQQQEAAPATQQDATTEPSYADRLLTAIERIEPAVRELIAEEDKVAAEEKRSRDKDDLEAQQDMAYWAMLMFIAAAASVVLTFIGLALIGRTLLYTKQAAIHAGRAVDEAKEATTAARETVRVTEDSSKRQLRAYVSVAPDGINPLRTRDRIIGHVRINNVGHAIAKDVRIAVRIVHSEDRHFDAFDISPDALTPTGAIAPGAEIGKGSYEVLASELLRTATKTDKPTYLFVYGIVRYRDGFDVERFTRFCHRYNGQSAEFINTGGNLPVRLGYYLVEPKIARYHETGNDAD